MMGRTPTPIDWGRTSEPFCAYVRRRKLKRRAMLAVLYQNAKDETGRHLADRLAKAWNIQQDDLRCVHSGAIRQVYEWVTAVGLDNGSGP